MRWIALGVLIGGAFLLAASTHANPEVHVREGEALFPGHKASEGAVMRQPTHGFGPGWSGNAQLSWAPTRIGARLELPFRVPDAGTYTFRAQFSKGPNCGQLSVGANGRFAGSYDGYAPTIRPSGMVALQDLQLHAGRNWIIFNLTGKNRRSTGFWVGIDKLELQRSTPVNVASVNSRLAAVIELERAVLARRGGQQMYRRLNLGRARTLVQTADLTATQQQELRQIMSQWDRVARTDPVLARTPSFVKAKGVLVSGNVQFVLPPQVLVLQRFASSSRVLFTIADWRNDGVHMGGSMNGFRAHEHTRPEFHPTEPLLVLDDVTDHNTWDVFTIRTDGTGLENLTRTPDTHESLPTWSPNGTQIAYFRKHGNTGEVWAMAADGTNQRKLATMTFVTDLAWSPDGGRIGLCGRQGVDEPEQLHIMNADGTQLAKVAPVDHRVLDLDWHPEGDMLVVSRGHAGEQYTNQPNVFRLWTITPPKTSNAITPDTKGGTLTDIEPQFSKNGNQVTFLSNRQSGGFFAVNTDGSNLRKIAIHGHHGVSALHRFRVNWR